MPIVVVGAGISGLVIAECYARAGREVLIIEKRNHVGGNCFDYINEFGVRVSQYGAHIFHTNIDRVWEYVNRFTSWRLYEHRVLSDVDGVLVPIPVNITTVNRLFGLNMKTEDDMRLWLSRNIVSIAEPRNSEEAALRRVGPILYEKMFKYYTKKQWDKWPVELEPEVLDRIPVRLNFDDRYFADKYQALPARGYTALFESMCDHCRIRLVLNTDYFDIRSEFKNVELTFFTGPIDHFFSALFGKLEYRSIRFELENFKADHFQSHAVINYPGTDKPFTRIIEHIHFQESAANKGTTITREYPTWDGEPYYPVRSERNRALYAEYQKLAAESEREGVFFVGRLANYKYFNMDQAFDNALTLFERVERAGLYEKW